MDAHARGGSDHGQLLIRLDVDGQFDLVSVDLHQTGDLAAIDRAITALERVREGLSGLYQGRGLAGRCMEAGDWGRCYGEHGHDGDHSFPTEEGWRSLHAV